VIENVVVWVPKGMTVESRREAFDRLTASLVEQSFGTVRGFVFFCLSVYTYVGVDIRMVFYTFCVDRIDANVCPIGRRMQASAS